MKILGSKLKPPLKKRSYDPDQREPAKFEGTGRQVQPASRQERNQGKSTWGQGVRNQGPQRSRVLKFAKILCREQFWAGLAKSAVEKIFTERKGLKICPKVVHEQLKRKLRISPKRSYQFNGIILNKNISKQRGFFAIPKCMIRTPYLGCFFGAC